MGFLRSTFLLAVSMLLPNVFAFGQHLAKGQRQAVPVQELIAKIDSFGYSRAPEKLYLQLDKPYYALGDTIWFKAYLLQAGLLIPSAKSGIIYLELANDSGRVIKRLKLPVVSGISWGNLALGEDEMVSGSYTIRAYTNWQRNFSESYEFKKNLYISSSNKNAWLVNIQSKVTSNAEGKHVNASLRLMQADNQPISKQDILLKVIQNKKNWYNNLLQTAADGGIVVNFDIPRSATNNQVVVELREKSKNGPFPQLFLPITLQDEDDIDLQFMPEGGKLVAGIPAHIGFKAISSNGYGVDVFGKIKNSKSEEVALFRSAFKGIGSVNFTPTAKEIYTATITLTNGTTKSFSLPLVESSGIVMRVKPASQLTDTLTLALASTTDVAANNADYYLIGQAKGIVCSASRVSFAQGTITGKINTHSFPAGTASITLFNETYQPVCERTVFIDHHKRLHIEVKPDQKSYKTRDSISLSLNVTDENGRPTTGNFSLAVTDDGQVKQDSLNGSIISNMLLTDDLKGEVEQPGYYLNDKGIQHLQELDNLLLTQGWVGYSWEEVITKPHPVRFAAEPGFEITGSVSNLFNHGLAGAKITLMCKNPLLIRDTTTDEQGNFVFNRLPLVDSAASFVLQARNKNG